MHTSLAKKKKNSLQREKNMHDKRHKIPTCLAQFKLWCPSIGTDVIRRRHPLFFFSFTTTQTIIFSKFTFNRMRFVFVPLFQRDALIHKYHSFYAAGGGPSFPTNNLNWLDTNLRGVLNQFTLIHFIWFWSWWRTDTGGFVSWDHAHQPDSSRDNGSGFERCQKGYPNTRSIGPKNQTKMEFMVFVIARLTQNEEGQRHGCL